VRDLRGGFEYWDPQVDEVVPCCDTFHLKNPTYLQHLLRGAVPSINLTFVIVYFAARSVFIKVKFSFEIPCYLNVGIAQ
jgi:hypothetical protein